MAANFIAVLFRGTFLVAIPFLIASSALPQASSKPSKSLLYQEAQQAMAKGDYERAIVAYQELIRVDSRSAPLLLQLGVAHYQKGDYESAAAVLRRALEIEPDFSVGQAFLGLSEAAVGHSDLSIPLLEKSLGSSDPAIDQELKRVIRMRLGQLYFNKGRLSDAESAYQSLLKDYPEDPQVLYEAFWLHTTRDREIMKTLLRKVPDSYRTHQMLGYLLAEKLNYPAAAEQFRLALKDNPDALGLHYELGNMLLSQSADGKSAAEEYEKELRLHPFHAPSYYKLAELALRDQQSNRAWELYHKALEFNPDYANAMEGLAKICMARNQPLDALHYCEKATKADPRNRPAHYLLARIYRTLGRNADARAEMALFEKLQSEASRESDYLSSVQIGGSEHR
jgi:tetratricopeptide (TPR) repeat protein